MWYSNLRPHRSHRSTEQYGLLCFHIYLLFSAPLGWISVNSKVHTIHCGSILNINTIHLWVISTNRQGYFCLGIFFLFLLFVPELWDENPSVKFKAKLDKHNTCGKTTPSKRSPITLIRRLSGKLAWRNDIFTNPIFPAKRQQCGPLQRYGTARCFVYFPLYLDAFVVSFWGWAF